MCLARNYTTHWHTRPEKTKWFGFDRQSAKHVRARRCSTAPLRPSPLTETYLFVLPLSAVYVSVKYRPNTDTVWPQPKAWVCGRSPAEIVGSNPTGGHGCFVCCDCCVLSSRGLCDELITRPEESYRLWCFVVCEPEPEEWGGHGPRGAAAPQRVKQICQYSIYIL